MEPSDLEAPFRDVKNESLPEFAHRIAGIDKGTLKAWYERIIPVFEANGPDGAACRMTFEMAHEIFTKDERYVSDLCLYILCAWTINEMDERWVKDGFWRKSEGDL